MDTGSTDEQMEAENHSKKTKEQAYRSFVEDQGAGYRTLLYLTITKEILAF